MIEYDPGRWSIAFAFSLRGSVFPKSVLWAAPCSATSIILHHVIHQNPGLGEHVGAGNVGTSVLAGFTFILGFLVVFRSQQAYSRWWEGGTLLQQLRGEWFNAYSSLLAFCNTAPDKTAEVAAFQHRLARLCSLLYCTAIQQVSTMEHKNYELIDIKDFDGESMRYMMESPDQCEVCLQWIQRLIGDADEKKILKVAPPILSRVYNQLGNGIVVLNNARKITEFPMPFPLAQMVTFMLLFHWAITAIICAASVKQAIWAGLLSFIVSFSFWSINYIAVELEQPFGDDLNDLPLHKMQADLNKSLIALLHPSAQQPPTFHFNKEEHTQLARTRLLFEEIQFRDNSSQLKEAIDTSEVALPQQVCAAHAAAPPQFTAETPPARTQSVPTVPVAPPMSTTCWSATGAATTFMSMNSRTGADPKPNGLRASDIPTGAVVYGSAAASPAAVFPRDTQGSGVAPVVKSADAVHKRAPHDVHLDVEMARSLCEVPSSRLCSLQEAHNVPCQRKTQCGLSRQSAPASSVWDSDVGNFPATGGIGNQSVCS